MVGPGTAIDPVREPTTAVAPVDGLVVSMHPHAFVVMDEDGHGVLTHLGIDTVQLNGEGFELLVSKGDQVKRGQPVISWNPAAVEASRQVADLPDRGTGGHARGAQRGGRDRRGRHRRRPVHLELRQPRHRDSRRQDNGTPDNAPSHMLWWDGAVVRAI